MDPTSYGLIDQHECDRTRGVVEKLLGPIPVPVVDAVFTIGEPEIEAVLFGFVVRRAELLVDLRVFRLFLCPAGHVPHGSELPTTSGRQANIDPFRFEVLRVITATVSQRLAELLVERRHIPSCRDTGDQIAEPCSAAVWIGKGQEEEYLVILVEPGQDVALDLHR